MTAAAAHLGCCCCGSLLPAPLLSGSAVAREMCRRLGRAKGSHAKPLAGDWRHVFTRPACGAVQAQRQQWTCMTRPAGCLSLLLKRSGACCQRWGGCRAPRGLGQGACAQGLSERWHRGARWRCGKSRWHSMCEAGLQCPARMCPRTLDFLANAVYRHECRTLNRP